MEHLLDLVTLVLLQFILIPVLLLIATPVILIVSLFGPSTYIHNVKDNYSRAYAYLASLL